MMPVRILGDMELAANISQNAFPRRAASGVGACDLEQVVSSTALLSTPAKNLKNSEWKPSRPGVACGMDGHATGATLKIY